MEQSQEQKSRRDQLVERLKAKYPDKEYADDEALFGQANDDYDDYDNQLTEYRDREGRLKELMSKDPKSAQFIADMAGGKDPMVELVNRIGIDGFTDLINNPEKQTEYAEANAAFLERVAKEKDLEAEYEKNLPESMRMLSQMQQERGLSDETIDAAMDLVMKMVNEAIVGKFTQETVEMALHMVSRDADLESARTEGEVAGRNAKIEERLRKPKGGDGLPQMGGSHNAPTRKGNGNSMFDLADLAR